MKASQQEDARLRYLQEGSALLVSASLALSTHLRLESTISSRDDAQTPSEQPQSCSACGSLLALGRSCRTLPTSSSKRTRKDRITRKPGAIKSLRLQCLRCDAVTIIETPNPFKLKKGAMSSSKPDRAAVPPRLEVKPSKQDEPTSKPLAPPPSRKRAKGKKTSLHSMLSEQTTAQTSAQKGFGLGLMDFMKT